MRHKPKKFNKSVVVQGSPSVLGSIRFFPKFGATLIIYDSDVGAIINKEKIRLNESLPSIDFGDKGMPFTSGIFALLSGEGEFFVDYN